MSSKKTNKKAPTNGFDTTTIDERLKNFYRFTWYAHNLPPWKNLSPLNRSFLLKLLSVPIPPLPRIFKNLQSPPKSWGDSHYGFVKTVNDFQQLTNFERRSILDVQQGSEYTSVSDLHICKYPIILAYLHLFTTLFRVQCYQNFLSFSYFADL